MFGDQTVLAVGGGSDSEPAVGVRVVGGQDTVDAVLALVSDAEGDVSAEPTSDGVVVSDDAAWAQALAAGGGFGDSQRFRDAVPEAGQASVVGFADLESLVGRMGGEVQGEQREALDALSSLGLSISSNGDTLTYRLRLLTR